MLVYLMVMLVNTYYIGHLNNPVLLAGVGMGNMLINVLCFAVTQGMNSALESFVSHSFGAGKYDKCGILLNRGKFVSSMVMVPLIIIYIFSEEILVALHQDRAISHIAKRYCCILIPGIWAQSMFDATRKFCSAQFITSVALYVQIFTLVLHFFWCWLFITHLDMKEVGAAIATNITYIANWMLQETWCKRNLGTTTYKPADKKMFNKVGKYLKVAIPGACMLCFEWWVFELLAIFSGLMSVEALAAEVVIVNIVSFIFMLPLGISYAASAFTGIFLGANKVPQAKKYARLTMLFNIFLTIIVIIILGLLRTQISHLFTHDDGTTFIIMDVLSIILLYIFFDTIHGV